eukprot:GEMP01100143.1.p1 GENE.GEMP01100143.1~~GEMP01100143.1.p1  ORF type:complete len:102 (-),score=2.97 GEMP01100143.1:25-330(-)
MVTLYPFFHSVQTKKFHFAKRLKHKEIKNKTKSQLFALNPQKQNNKKQQHTLLNNSPSSLLKTKNNNILQIDIFFMWWNEYRRAKKMPVGHYWSTQNVAGF